MRKVFTDLAVQNFDEGIFFDKSLPNFGIRIGQRTKTWFVMTGRERSKTTLGHYPDLSLKEARRKALVLIDGPPMSTRPYSEVVHTFLEAQNGRLKPDTLSQYRYYLTGFKFAYIELTKPQIFEALKQYEKKPWAQNYAYASLRIFLNWCLDQEYLDRHPLIRGKPPNKTKPRSRVLSDEELGRIWRCTGDNAYGRILRLLMLTGQRRMEVRNLTPAQVSDGLITFHTKGDKINVLPITPLVQENLILPFHFNNWGDAKRNFDEDCGVSFRHHDLRRTLSTKLASLGTDVIVIERILGHTLVGVAGIYNKHSYLPEMKEALLRYENHIRSILSAP